MESVNFDLKKIERNTIIAANSRKRLPIQRLRLPPPSACPKRANPTHPSGWLHLSQLAALDHSASVLDGTLGHIPGVVVVPFERLVFRATLLDPLFVPLVDDRVVQILVAAGTLGDDADDVEVGELVVGTIELQHDQDPVLSKWGGGN